MSFQKDEAIRLRLEERLSYNEISSRLGVSKGSLSHWLRDYPLTKDEKATRHPSVGGRRTKAVRPLASAAFGVLTSGEPVKVGKAAEHLFIAACLVRGIDCFSPVTEDGRVDFIVGPGLWKVQVKMISEYSDALPLNKISVNTKTNTKITTYHGQVDFFVGVDVMRTTFYVVEMGRISDYSKSISVNTLINMGCVNAFDGLMQGR